ncbi:SPFH domain-containing protein [Acidipila sp. EB88]|nr:SPFH domain-containing protein [Acidipila sp. EB88]
MQQSSGASPRRKRLWIPAAATTLAVLLSLTACGRATPDAGHAIVLVEKPLFFGHGGVDSVPVQTGSVWIAPTTQTIDVSMVPERHDLRLNDLMTSDGVPLDFDAIILLQVTDPVALIAHFGTDWYHNNVEREFAILMRDQVKTHGMNETAIASTALDSIDQKVGEGMSRYLREAGLPVRLIGVTAGKANPPDAVKSQRIETAQQEQRALTEAQTKIAEDARKAAETSRAEADNAYRNSLGLSPEQFIELQRIKMQENVCLRHTCTFISGNASALVNTR